MDIGKHDNQLYFPLRYVILNNDQQALTHFSAHKPLVREHSDQITA